MDSEYDRLNENNEKYAIQISDAKARLRAMEKDFTEEIFLVCVIRSSDN
jgi:hypothetical protein